MCSSDLAHISTAAENCKGLASLLLQVLHQCIESAFFTGANLRQTAFLHTRGKQKRHKLVCLLQFQQLLFSAKAGVNAAAHEDNGIRVSAGQRTENLISFCKMPREFANRTA